MLVYDQKKKIPFWSLDMKKDCECVADCDCEAI